MKIVVKTGAFFIKRCYNGLRFESVIRSRGLEKDNEESPSSAGRSA